MNDRQANRLRLEWILLALVITAGLAFRMMSLDASGFACDEAESSINALTILQKGYPIDHYLGLPIYENTLVQPWPGSPEYEFRDVSYSDRGVAVYHGWFPLYTIAASFALLHIQPDVPEPALNVKYERDEWKRRTRAGRLPGVLFGGLFLAIAFIAGSVFYGRDAGWIALLSLTFHPWHVVMSGQARYYSATIAISTGCCLMVWIMVTRRRWRDYCIGALAFVLLFHTHLLSFAVAGIMLGLLTPMIVYRHPGDVVKLAVFGTSVSAGTLPWLFLTNFYKHQSLIPRSWALLSLPADFLRFPPAQLVMLAIPCLFFLMASAALASSRFPSRLKAALTDSLAPLLFLGAWAGCGYCLFLLFMPAASFFRNSMSYWGPDHLMLPVIAASVARMITSTLRPNQKSGAILESIRLKDFLIGSSVQNRRTDLVSGWTIIAALLLMVQSCLGSLGSVGTKWSDLDGIARTLQAMNLQKDTRLYASPNDHLILTFYTGLPIQSIAPVRKSFLDEYHGDVVYIQRGAFDPDPDTLVPRDLRSLAFRHGTNLSRPGSETLSTLLRTRDYRQRILEDVTGLGASIEEAPLFARDAFFHYEEQSRSRAAAFAPFDLMTRGFSVATLADWSEIFVYRFVNPNSRRGPNLNYAARLRGSKAYVLASSGTVIFRSAARMPRDGTGIDFTFVK
jgi:hypothetical protein